MRPICVPCQRFFEPKKNDYWFTEGAPIREKRDAAPGTAEPENWRPYKIWAADLYECPGCKAQILSGFGREPIAISHQIGFKEKMESLGADQFQVNDC